MPRISSIWLCYLVIFAIPISCTINYKLSKAFFIQDESEQQPNKLFYKRSITIFDLKKNNKDIAFVIRNKYEQRLYCPFCCYLPPKPIETLEYIVVNCHNYFVNNYAKEDKDTIIHEKKLETICFTTSEYNYEKAETESTIMITPQTENNNDNKNEIKIIALNQDASLAIGILNALGKFYIWKVNKRDNNGSILLSQGTEIENLSAIQDTIIKGIFCHDETALIFLKTGQVLKLGIFIL